VLRLVGPHWPIALLLLASGLAYGQTLGAYGMLMWDEAEYASLARSVVRGDGYTIAGEPQVLRPPILPLAGAASLWAAGRVDDRVLKRATVAMALLALAIVYAGAARAYDPATGLVASALMASTPWFWTSTANFLSEIPLLAFFGGAVFCWTFGLYRSPRYFYLSWLCIGLAFLTRYTALLFGPLAVGLTAAALATRDRAVQGRVLSRDFALAPLLGVVVVAPWFARQAVVFGDPLVGLRQAATQLQVYLPGVSMPWYQYLVGLPAILSPPTTVFLVVGIAWTASRADRFGAQCVIVVVFVVTWFSCYRYKEPRLITAMLPAAAVLAAVGLTRGLPGGRAVRAGGAAVVLAGTVAFNGVAAHRVFDRTVTLGYPSFLQAMVFVRDHSSPAALLVGPNRPQIFWYADRTVVDFPAEAAALPALLERADWVVITNFERGQKSYVSDLARKIPRSDFQDQSAVLFQDGRYMTLVVRADRLRARL
jgi:4-amino-4-deoxy-L-arabinose transferase-like glycosyltransferase